MAAFSLNTATTSRMNSLPSKTESRQVRQPKWKKHSSLSNRLETERGMEDRSGIHRSSHGSRDEIDPERHENYSQKEENPDSAGSAASPSQIPDCVIRQLIRAANSGVFGVSDQLLHMSHNFYSSIPVN
jgi:hypothetical protein